MLGRYMHSPVGFGSYGNAEYGFAGPIYDRFAACRDAPGGSAYSAQCEPLRQQFIASSECNQVWPGSPSCKAAPASGAGASLTAGASSIAAGISMPGMCNDFDPCPGGQARNCSMASMSSIEGVTYDSEGCPYQEVSQDGNEVRILVPESEATPEQRQMIQQTRQHFETLRLSNPDVKITQTGSWFANLTMEKKLAFLGMGFGALLILIFAFKMG